MKNTIYAVIASCLAMLATSGIIALATAAPRLPTEAEALQAEVDDYISEFIDREVQKLIEGEREG